MPAPDDLVIKCNGATVSVWQSFTVTRGIELLPSTCEITATERLPSMPSDAVVAPFDVCEVFLGADKILTGYVDVYAPEADAEHHEVTIGARSKTEDVVDCSVDVDALSAANGGSWQIKSATIGQAAKMLCEPYGIKVVLPDDDPPLNVQYPIAVQPGMTVYHVIEELARMTQMLIWDNENGDLVISRVGTKRADPLVEGTNLKVEAARLSGDQRYQSVKVFGTYYFADQNGPHISYEGTATDSQVPRKRLLMIPIDMPGPDGKWVTQRAQWEVARRLGRSRVVRAVVTGLRDSKGALWQPNTVSRVQMPTMKIPGEDMVVAQVTWSRNQSGTTTTLMCAPPEAFKIAPFTFRPLITLDPATQPTASNPLAGGRVPT